MDLKMVMTITKSTMSILVLSQLIAIATAQSLCQTEFNYEYFIQNVPENTPAGSTIGHVQIAGTDAEIFLIQRPNDYFIFDSISRNVSLARQLDTDQNATEIPVLILNCTILGQNSDPYKITVRVIVDDWNDNPPVFISYHHNTSISEDAEIGTKLYTDTLATDNDKRFTRNSRISYRIVENTTYSDYFQISTLANPVITLRRKLDYEAVDQMTVLIEARDNPFPSSGTPKSSTATLTVYILDADDQNPIFPESTYRGSIAQDAPLGTTVIVTPILYAEDPDTMNVSIKYSLWDLYDVFQIDNVTAAITKKAPFTASLQTVTLVVLGTQVDNEDRETFTLLTVTIEAANINAPRFSKTLYEVEKLELEPVGSILETTTAADIDFIGQTGTQIQYSIVEPIEDIVINNEGSLILQRSLDYEIRQEWILHVTASDGSNTATATVIINVLDVNDNNPVFDPVQTDILINREQGRLVTIVTATDGDFDTLSYFLQNYQSLFAINNDGELYVTASEDQLTKDEYTVLVTVTDNRTPPRTNTTNVNVRFPPLGFTLPPTTGSTVGVAPASVLPEDNMITIILGALAGVLLIVIVILVIVLIIRQKRMKEALNRAREPKGYAAKGLTYRQAESPDDLPKMDLHYADDTDGTSEYDGATTIQENPLTDNGVNEGYLQSSVSDEMDREINEIEIETAVVPYDDDFGYPSGRTKYSGHMRTFQGDDSTSSGSAQSDSTGGSRRVLVNGDKNDGGSKLTSWDSDDKIHPQGAEKLLDQGLPNKQKGEKPEITVYF